MTHRNITIALHIVFASVLIFWDLFAAASPEERDTVSAVFLDVLAKDKFLFCEFSIGKS